MPIDWLTLGAALLSGLLGGAHCAAMCGGIATGFSAVSTRGGWPVAFQANLGRVGGYTIAGAMAGGLGSGILDIARMQWLAMGLRMLVGIVMVVIALRLMDRRNRLGFLSRPGVGAWRLLRPLQQHLSPADTGLKRIGMGLLWGWLPCGLSTTMLMAAWFQATALNGALTMAAFGLGTLPVMLPLTWSGARLGQWLQRPARRTALALVVLSTGLVTMAAPWLMKASALHGILDALGCHSAPI